MKKISCSSLTSQQFMRLKPQTIEKRILAFYQTEGNEKLLTKETVLLLILHQLRNDQQTYTPCCGEIRSFYLEKLSSHHQLFYLGFFRHFFKAYFSAFEWLQLAKHFQRLTHFFQQLSLLPLLVLGERISAIRPNKTAVIPLE